MILEREAFERLRHEGALFPAGVHQALIWFLGVTPGEDVSIEHWAPGAFERLQAEVARAVLAAPTALSLQKAKRVIVDALCDGDDEQYSVHVTHSRQADAVLVALAKHRVVRVPPDWPN